MTYQDAFGGPFGGSGSDPESIKPEFSPSDSKFLGVAYNADIGILFSSVSGLPQLTVDHGGLQPKLYVSPIGGFRFRADLVTASIDLDSDHKVFFQLE
jgi:hypothetical protein